MMLNQGWKGGGGENDYRGIIYNELVSQGQTENTELNLDILRKHAQ